MIRKLTFVILALALVACGNKEDPSKSENMADNEGFKFKVIRSPVTGKCYEAVNVSRSYSFSRIFEISCDYKNKQ